jgi:ATP-dependent DNA ligase
LNHFKTLCVHCKMEFPVLFKSNRQWSVGVRQSGHTQTIVRTYGTIDGKMTTTHRHVTNGKNIGKKNETNAYEQACAEAQAMWIRQKATGYAETVDAGCTRKYAPMLATSYDVDAPKVTFPCYVQPKLDGVRLLVYSHDGQLCMMSRTGKNMSRHPNLQCIRAECSKLLKTLGDDVCLDGELYGPELAFETIVSLCRTSNDTSTTRPESFGYHVYDIINGESFERRHQRLDNGMANIGRTQWCTLVATHSCADADQVENLHDALTDKGFEGVMIRDPDGLYREDKRSASLQKFKRFKDEEYTIVGFKEGDGRDEGTIVFECALPSPEGHTFWVRPTGSFEYRSRLWKDRESLLSKRLTVTFQELTQRGVPRFPIGKCIRDYE